MKKLTELVDGLLFICFTLVRDVALKRVGEIREEHGLAPPIDSLPTDGEVVFSVPRSEPLPPPKPIPSIPLPPPSGKRRGRPPKTERPTDPSTSFEDTVHAIQNGLPKK